MAASTLQAMYLATLEIAINKRSYMVIRGKPRRITSVDGHTGKHESMGISMETTSFYYTVCLLAAMIR